MSRLAYVAKDGTPHNVPIAFIWNGSHIVMCTTKNAPKLSRPPSRTDGLYLPDPLQGELADTYGRIAAWTLPY